MKKSKLYKLVQESLKEVIQEQTRTAPTADASPDSPAGDFADPQATQGLTPDVAVGTADVQTDNDPDASPPTNNTGTQTSPFCYYGNPDGFPDDGTYIGHQSGPNAGAGPTSADIEYEDFGSIGVRSTSCDASLTNIQETATIDDTWICCGSNNESSTTIYGLGQGWNIDDSAGNLHGPSAFAAWPCYCPNPQIRQSVADSKFYLISCDVNAAGNNNDPLSWNFSTVQAHWTTNNGSAYPLAGDNVTTGVDQSYGTGARCAGCKSPDAIDQQGVTTTGNYLVNDLNEYYPDIIGCPSSPGDYSNLDPDNITCCNFEGCTDETSTYSNADGSTPGVGAGALGAYNYSNGNYTSAVTQVTGGNTTYTPSSFLAAVAAAGQTGTFTDDGSCNYPGCPDAAADNQTTNTVGGVVNVDDGTCTGLIAGCQDVNFSDDGSDIYDQYINGNYNANANQSANCILDPYCPNNLALDAQGNATNIANINYVCNFQNGYFCNGVMGAQGTPDTAGVLQFSVADVNECIETVPGCTDSTKCNYDANANVDDGSCSDDICTGCMDDGSDPGLRPQGTTIVPSTAEACNVGENRLGNDVGLYSPSNLLGLQYHDSSVCDYTACAGCIYQNMDNYSTTATIDDGSCTYEGCLDATNSANGNTYQNWVCDPTQGHDNLCTDTGNANGTLLNPLTHNTNLGTFTDTSPTSCSENQVDGCTDQFANNYNPAANTDDGSCTYDCYEINYTPCNPEVNTQSGTLGCVQIDQALPALGQKFKMAVKQREAGMVREKIDRPAQSMGKFEVTGVTTPTNNTIQQLSSTTCFPTSYICKCIPNRECPNNPNTHSHRCLAVTDGSGYLSTYQECMDFCPCEITNPVAATIQYSKQGLESCAGHNNEIYPKECMNASYGGELGKDDDTKIIPSDQPITPIEPADIPTIDIPSIDIPGENPDTPDRKINEVELSKKIRKAFKNLYK